MLYKMEQELDLKECLKDSPKFRSVLEDKEHSIAELESHLEKLVKISIQMVETGKSYYTAMGSLMAMFDSLCSFFEGDEFVSTSLKKLNGVLSDLQTFFSVFLEQTQKSITNSLNIFIKEDIKTLKETKKNYDKHSDDLDSARIRNSQMLKNCKPSDGEECINQLSARQARFNRVALDYAFQINSIQEKRRFHILSQVVLFVNGHFLYHKHGSETHSKYKEYQEELNRGLESLQLAYTNQKEIDERHRHLHEKSEENDNIMNTTLPRNRSKVIMDGYLFKRSSNAFKNWHRRWFVIQNNKLYYTRRSNSESVTEMVDLRLSTVKQANDCDRRFSFVVVCPTKCWYLQADNEKMKERWISIMQMAIARALYEPDSGNVDGNITEDDTLETDKLHPQFLLERLSQLPGNDVCADCSSAGPKWASINLGILLCIECSGVHRSLGVHISKVRSVTLDDWDPETIKLMLELGNEVMNNIYEASVTHTQTKPLQHTHRSEKETWIRSKYVDKKFISPVKVSNPLKRGNVLKKGRDGLMRSYSFEKIDVVDPSPPRDRKLLQSCSTATARQYESSGESNDEDQPEIVVTTTLHPNALLYRAAKNKDLAMMAMALASGADAKWHNFEVLKRTALHETVLSGSVSASELLLQNGASVNAVDKHLQTPLHYAASHGSTGHTCLFLKRDAIQKSLDDEGQDPLTIALKNTHADIVTLFRLAQLHEEIKETDIDMAEGETVTNVFRDFSNMASNNPERLNRNTRQTMV